MKETRVKISSIIENQLPQFVVEEFPLISEFLSQYYISLESQGSVSDLLQNIYQYVKVDNLTNLIESTALSSDITSFDTSIGVKLDPENGFYGTIGFPDSYGILLIDSEIITYTSKTETSFEGCVRGFSGITSLDKKSDELVFSTTLSEDHISTIDGSPNKVTNLSILFLKEFLNKIKIQFTPGFENRELYSNLNQNIFIKNAIDFYSSKGTDNSFKILFSALYGEKVEVIKPRDYLIQASDAQYRITSDIVVESIEGNPELLVNQTLYQDETEFINSAKGTITNVERIQRNSKFNGIPADYYIISLDSDYDKDIQPTGTIYGEFSIHPKTKLISSASSSSTTLEVDSTVGFPSKNGNLIVDLEDGTSLTIQYSSKTLNQFLDCNISQNVSEGTEVKLDAFAYGYVGIGTENVVKVRILGVLSDLTIPDDASSYSENDTIKIKTLGIYTKNPKLNSWFFNIPTKYNVKSIFLSDSSDNSYTVNTYDDHSFRIGDNVTLLSSTGIEQSAIVSFFNDEKSFNVKFGSEVLINQNLSYTIRKKLSKVSSQNYPLLNDYTSNVQNVYYENEDTLYVASPSIPSYSDPSTGSNINLQINDRSVKFSGTFYPDDESDLNKGTTISVGNHGFYTGDSVAYIPDINDNLGITSGIYFVKKVSETEIKLARSKDNIFTEKYVSLTGTSENSILRVSDFVYKNLSPQLLDSQRLIRKISTPQNENNTYDTKPGSVGILINGVEITNYKSKDNVYYGPIKNIVPTAPGVDYDVINPPTLTITDSIGYGAKSHCSVLGSLERIDIIDPGFDYIEEPQIEIKGGNGKDASAKVKLISFDHEVNFNSEGLDGLIKLNSINTIGFSTYHKFRDSEEVVYLTGGQVSVGGLSTNSTYFVSVLDAYNIQLHNSISDSVTGINTVQLSSYGKGNHKFKSKNKKQKIGSIVVENKGSNYQNKLIVINSSGISTTSNIITAVNHGYNSGEIITYNAIETPISGLSSSTSYYVTKVNDDQFRLSQVAVSTLGITSSFYYDTKEYVKLTSVGSGNHKFNYPEITVNVIGKIGVSTSSSQNYNAIVQPIFRGGIQSIFVESGGFNYGSEKIINHNRQPSFKLNSGSGIELNPIISNGKIVDVVIKNFGSGYNSPPNIKIKGKGSGALLTPIFSNGSLIDVKVIYSGSGYNPQDTYIEVTPSGRGAKFEAQIKSWKINLVDRLLKNNQIPEDDGILVSGLSGDYGTQYTHAYAPKLLRSLVQGTSFRDGKKTYVNDLQRSNGVEIDSIGHSPIIGWAYDGNPIYGPYGYSIKNNGGVKALTSGYKLLDPLPSSRPSTSIYPSGFFVEDYEYTGDGDLDEHNGTFAKTPEYPNGVYAYFTTIGDVVGKYKRPVFPYVVGNSYKSSPIEFNFKSVSNQDQIDVNDTNWRRNIFPYNLLDTNSSYEYLLNPNNIKPQNSIVINSSIGKVNSIGIFSGGTNYKVNEKLIFNGASIFDAKAKVSLIEGKQIQQVSVASSSLYNVEFYSDNKKFIGFASSPHSYLNNDLITFTGKYDYKKSGLISISNNNLVLTSGVGSANYTGFVTYFNVMGNLDFPSIKENDIYEIKGEQIKILNIDKEFSRIRVLRNQNNTTGITSYSSGDYLTEKTRKFIVNFGISTSYNFTLNKEFYFDPEKSVGLGTNFGVGIGHTLFLSVTEFNHPVSIGTGATTFLYFNDIKDLQSYVNGGYVDLVKSTNSSFNTSKKKIISIGSTSIGIDFNTSSFVGVGVTSYVNKWNLNTIPTKSIYLQNHGLNTGDELIYNSNGGSSIGVSTDGTSNFTISDGSKVYAAKITNDLIGISTVKVGLGSTGIFVSSSYSNSTLYFTSLGIGSIHSFKTNYSNTLTGQISKNVVTVTTKDPHELSLLDNVFVDVKTGITTTYIVKYDDYNRRLVLNPRSFSSVDVENNLITINNHSYYNGQKVIYTSSTPSSGLTNENIYYVVVIDSNNIKLSNTYYGSIKENPTVVDISSSSSGTISPINPPIKIFGNQEVIFDLSDSSLSFIRNSEYYSAFDFKIFEDKEFNYEFTSTKLSQTSEVSKIGKVGIDSEAKVIIKYNDNVPKNLYYNLIPVNLDLNLQTKKEIFIDNEVIGFNKIDLDKSFYSGKQTVVGISSTTFKYNILNTPEVSSYSNGVEYYTNSKTSKGSIKEVSILDGGKYSILPGISSVYSENGYGAVLVPNTNSIGKILSTKIQDIGFDYSCDNSVRPLGKLPSIINLEPLSSLNYIDIVSFGVNYTSVPSLVLIDSVTNKVISDVELNYSPKSPKVNIIKNSSSISNISPKIVPTNNSNGFRINNISFNDATKDVTVTLKTEISKKEDFPFKIGSKVLIEGVSVGINSTGKGYNSSKYDYTLFTLVGINTSLGGGNPTVTYNLSSYLDTEEFPGTFSSVYSSGKVIPESHFPKFNIVLKKNDFYLGESVYSDSYQGKVVYWDKNNQIIKISTLNDFASGDLIVGKTSGSVGIIKSVKNFDVDYTINSYSLRKDTWRKETGFLNNDFQRLHDNDYYQYFSYSIKSKKDLNTWDDAVTTLNHTAGFKKFSDLVIESNSFGVGVASTEQNKGDFTSVADLSGVIDVNCVFDFDLARENNLVIDDTVISDEIIFNSRIIQDYIESIGNRVLMIDDISGQFNSNPRPTKFSVVDSFDFSNSRSKKYFSLIQDQKNSNEKQLSLVSLIHNDSVGFINQYCLDIFNDLGSFDFDIFGSKGRLLFYPINSDYNDYYLGLLSFSLNDSVSGVGTISLGDSVLVSTSSTSIPQSTSTTTTIVGIASTYRSSKILVQIGATDSSYYEYNEITVIHNNTDVHLLDYGQITTNTLSAKSSPGIGTYNAYIYGNKINIDIIPTSSTTKEYYVNSFVVSLASTESSGIGTEIISGSSLNSSAVSISSSPTPVSNTISSYSNIDYSGAYYIISIEDKTNSQYQVSELLSLTNSDLNECYSTEYGVIKTNSDVGVITTGISGSNTIIYFTPIENIDVDVKVFQVNIELEDGIAEVSLNNGSINYAYGTYTGSFNDIKKSFELTHKNLPIFYRNFKGNDSNIVSIEDNLIKIPNHFYTTGEEIEYSYPGYGTTQAIGIATTSIIGIGMTDKLPTTLYIVKINDLSVRVAASASDSLNDPPNVLKIESVGVGSIHTFKSKNQNKKVLISIDNNIQSPIVSTSVTTTLSSNVTFFNSEIFVSDVNFIRSGDLIKINNEIMKVLSVGVGSTNALSVFRPWFGTELSNHTSSDVVKKITGNYNIVNNKIHFSEAPYGKVPQENPDIPSEIDYVGISTGSSFSGRVFLRSGIPNTSQESYSSNYIIDDISVDFNGTQKTFTLKSEGSNVSGISTDNAILLINEIFQGPDSLGDYNLTENIGITSVTFTGTSSSITYDVNNASIPRGGVILSVGSSQGFGYQPLVSAGGTAIVSIAGTIQSISIGNSGSGYRVGIQTIVNVGVIKSDTNSPNIEFIGIASINNGNVVSVAITNPGTGYASTNPPIVVFDDPLSYSNIPLIYSSKLPIGIGTGATVDIVVGQGSSVISFEFKNLGYGYKEKELLTVSVGGTIGIPTNTTLSFSEFEVEIDRTYSDKFSAWTIGNLTSIDSIESLFDGKRITFPIRISGNQTTIRSKKGSNIDVQSTLLVFINDILQVPGKSYQFKGGSNITFYEAPKEDDTCKILFYKGTDGVDTLSVDILESIKVGDKITLDSDYIYQKENERSVVEIISSDSLKTNVYNGPGVTQDENLLRPLIWCRQTEDLIIDGKEVSKNRVIYEPYIQPSTNIIQNVGINTNIIFVDSIKAFFDSEKEYEHNGTNEKPQNKIIITSQNSLVAASATAIVSTSGTISSINIVDGGVGYTTTPSISISNPTGIGTTGAASAIVSISSGIVSSVAITTGGFGYSQDQLPLVLIESPSLNQEIINDVSYIGDFGIVTGVSTVSVGVASTGIIFDLYIPQDSILRNSNIVSPIIQTSGIQTGYYFVIRKSNIGFGVTSLGLSGNIVGIGTSFIDNIYIANSVAIAQTAVSGVGLTYVAKVTVSVSNYNGLSGLGYSNFYGEYSWGRISATNRPNPKEFTSNNFISGISSSPIVQRFTRLKYIGYSTT